MANASIGILTDGKVSSGAVLWRYRERLQLTVVVKAAFTIVPDGDATHAGAAEVARDDRTFGGIPSRSVEVGGDLSPYRARCDVTFVGHAHAPAGKPAPAGSVRLGLARDGKTLIDKVLHVFGDRGAGGAPEPWARMPLVYERALGGPGEPNPVGIEAPNVVDPRDARAAAGLAPISRFWPSRKRLIGKIDRSALEGPIARIPDEMPWDYYQSAPPDQQVEPLRGGEWLVLDGIHPSLARVQTRLPQARGAARVLVRQAGSPPREHPVEMACDTLSIDGDRQTLCLVWRGRFEIAGGEAAIDAHTILAGLEAPGAAVDWARLAAQASEAEAPSAAASEPAEDAGDGTMAISSERAIALSQRAPVPFQAPSAGPAPAGPAPAGPAPAPASTAATPWGAQAPSPVRAAAPGEMTISGPSQSDVGEGTYALRADQQAVASQRSIAPFALQSPGAPSASGPASNRGALPWSGAAAAPAPVPIGEETMALGASSAPLAPAMMAWAPSAATPTETSATEATASAAAPVDAPAPEPAKAPSPPRPKMPPPRVTKAPAFLRARPEAPKAAPASPPPLADRLRASGASAGDVAALLKALEPPPPPPDED